MLLRAQQNRKDIYESIKNILHARPASVDSKKTKIYVLKKTLEKGVASWAKQFRIAHYVCDESGWKRFRPTYDETEELLGYKSAPKNAYEAAVRAADVLDAQYTIGRKRHRKWAFGE